VEDTSKEVENLRHVVLNKIVVMEHLFRSIERNMASMSKAVEQCRKMLEDGKR